RLRRRGVSRGLLELDDRARSGRAPGRIRRRDRPCRAPLFRPEDQPVFPDRASLPVPALPVPSGTDPASAQPAVHARLATARALGAGPATVGTSAPAIVSRRRDPPRTR